MWAACGGDTLGRFQCLTGGWRDALVLEVWRSHMDSVNFQQCFVWWGLRVGLRSCQLLSLQFCCKGRTPFWRWRTVLCFTIPETNIAIPNETSLPTIFRCYVSFREGIHSCPLLSFERSWGFLLEDEIPTSIGPWLSQCSLPCWEPCWEGQMYGKWMKWGTKHLKNFIQPASRYTDFLVGKWRDSQCFFGRCENQWFEMSLCRWCGRQQLMLFFFGNFV